MPYPDLKAFLADLERSGDLVRVTRPVSPHLELGAIVYELCNRQGPAVLFERVEGAPLPVLCNLYGARDRVARAVGVQPRDLLRHYLQALEHPLPTKLVSDAPCQEVVRSGADLDLTALLPQILWHPEDGGPYITMGLVVCKDPESGAHNMAIYRMQHKERNTLGIKLQPPQHGGVCRAKADELGRPLQVAVAIGGDPALYVGAEAVVPFGTSEMTIAGALRGDPIEVVRAKSVDLEVPASAELVLEGEVLPNVLEPEGPFGEFQGYYSGSAPRQVLKIHTVTHRRSPLYLATYEGRPITNTHILHAAAKEPVYFRAIKEYVCPTVRDVCVTSAGNASSHVVASIKKQAAGQGKNVLLELMKRHQVKLAVVVDEDIDPRDPMQVEWAIATRVQADRDVIIIPYMAGPHLDPSQPQHPSGRGAKMGIDATMPFGNPYHTVRFPNDLLTKVRARWRELGLPEA